MRELLRYAFLGLMPLAVGAVSDTSPRAPQKVRLNIVGGRPVVDDVFLNGHGPYRFLLDTGGQTNQVEAALARRLAFNATFQVEMVTPAGPFLAPGGRVGHVSLGPVKATNQEFVFTSLAGIHAFSPNIRGSWARSSLRTSTSRSISETTNWCSARHPPQALAFSYG